MDFSKRLIDWYEVHKRDLPWRQTIDPYIVWLSEIILQQTRVDQGLPYFQRFKENHPTVQSLASASNEEVMRLWQGLGYYSRARNLHKAAKTVVEKHGGSFPNTFEDLLSLPGIGPYTASAIASFCYNLPNAVVDGNVIRVISRFYGITEPVDQSDTKKKLDQLAHQLLSKNDPSTHNQAIMEFGALYCKPVAPDCDQCIFKTECVAHRRGVVHEIPFKSGKTKIRNRYFNYLITTEMGITLLRKRTGKDIWQDLFEPPMIESNASLSAQEIKETTLWKDLFGNKKIDVSSVRDRKPHKLSHQTIHCRIFFLDAILDANDLKSKGIVSAQNRELDKYAVPRVIEQLFEECVEGYGN